MSDIIKSVAKLSQTVISQFFSPVNAEEARTANAKSNARNRVCKSEESKPAAERVSRSGKRFKGNLKIFQLNTAKMASSGSSLSRLMGDCTNSLAFVTEPPFYHGKVCGFSSAMFDILHYSGNNKRCRAAIIASKGVALCPKG